METLYLQDFENSEPITEKVVPVLKNGGVVAVPTDTVYGLAVDAMNKEAIEKLFKIKGRSREKSIPVLAANMSMVDRVARVNASFRITLSRFWPGPLTAVFMSRGVIPNAVSGGTPTIGIRIPNHAFVLDLIAAFGGVLAVTSANLSGSGSKTAAHEVVSEFHGRQGPDLVIDGGVLGGAQASTVVDFTKIPPVVLREGPIKKEEILSAF